MKFTIIAMALLLPVIGFCASLRDTKKLKPGMTTKEVETIFNEPAEVQMLEGTLVWTYYMHQPFQGYRALHMGFHDDKLSEWLVDSGDNPKQRAMEDVFKGMAEGMSEGMKASQQKEPQEINVNIRKKSF